MRIDGLSYYGADSIAARNGTWQRHAAEAREQAQREAPIGKTVMIKWFSGSREVDAKFVRMIEAHQRACRLEPVGACLVCYLHDVQSVSDYLGHSMDQMVGNGRR